MGRELPVHYAINHIEEVWLDKAVRAAPFYDAQFAVAMQWIQRCIHGLKGMHRSEGLAKLEVYLGRATRSSLRQRWTSHARDPRRRHQYGAILFRCDATVVQCLEDVAIALLSSSIARRRSALGMPTSGMETRGVSQAKMKRLCI